MPPAPLKPVVLVCLIGFAVARIVSTYHVFSQTWDEAAHLGAGMEWLQRGTYTYDVQHPPLARVAIALGPHLSGLRLSDQQDIWALQAGNHILHSRGTYSHNLALARLGVLPFLLLATGLVWAWARWLFGDMTALVAVLLFTTLPPVLAHAGLATTDAPLMATCAGALLALTSWLAKPTLPRSLMLGVAGALALLSKLSALVFLPVCGVAIVVWRWIVTRGTSQVLETDSRRRLISLGGAVLVMLGLLWAGYRFSFRPFTTAAERPHEIIDQVVGTDGIVHDLAYVVAEAVPIPAREFLLGINEVRRLQTRGWRSYLLGEISQGGRWYFFPVALAVKTPIPFLILAGIGLGFLSRQAWRQNIWQPMVPAVAAVTMLLICLPNRINAGLRYLLPIYPLLAIVAAVGAVRLWAFPRLRVVGSTAVVGLLAWQFASSLAAHPDYLAHFNELAGEHPERILVDSDLDWGQDLLRLTEELRARHVERVAIAYHGSADLSRHGLPAVQDLVPYEPTTGWIAISEMRLKTGDGDPPYDDFAWLEAYEPVARVGRSIRLYHVPPIS